MSKPRTLLQEVYFDVCDLLYGNSYKDISYDDRTDFLLSQKYKLEQIEKLLFPESE